MFDKLDLKFLKGLIKDFKLSTKLTLSKVVDGKRKAKTRKELSDELHKHLEIRSDGEIVMKEHKYGKIPSVKNKAPVKAPVKAPKKPVKESQKPKIINENDSFVIYDNQSNENNETIDLTNYFVLNDVLVFNNPDDLISVVGDVSLMDFPHMLKDNSERLYNNYIYKIREKDYLKYEKRISDVFPNIDERYIQIFITRGVDLVGFIRSTFEYGEDEYSDLHISFVYVNDNGFQGKGYVGEMMSILFEYLIKIDVLKDVKRVDLDYAADSSSAWIAYDKGISRYGFKNKDLKYTNEDLNDPNFIENFHKNLYDNDDGASMLWDAVKKGSGLMRRPIEQIEMKI